MLFTDIFFCKRCNFLSEILIKILCVSNSQALPTVSRLSGQFSEISACMYICIIFMIFMARPVITITVLNTKKLCCHLHWSKFSKKDIHLQSLYMGTHDLFWSDLPKLHPLADQGGANWGDLAKIRVLRGKLWREIQIGKCFWIVSANSNWEGLQGPKRSSRHYIGVLLLARPPDKKTFFNFHIQMSNIHT